MRTRILLAGVVAVVAAVAISGIVVAQHPAVFDLKFGSMTGAKERQAADPDGRGTASATLVEPDTLCYALTVAKIDDPIAAHIHRGRPHENGPVVIPLTPPSSGNPGTSSACISGISAELMQELRIHPDLFYWNVHTNPFPGGAIRGQVFNHR